MEYLRTNHMMSIAMNRKVNRPTKPQELEQVEKIDLTDSCLTFHVKNEYGTEECSKMLADLEEVDSLEEFCGVKKLNVSLECARVSSTQLRVLLECGRLPGVEELVIYTMGKIQYPQVLTRWTKIFRNVKYLELAGSLEQQEWSRLVQDMPEITNLVIKMPIHADTLLRWNMPNLKELMVEEVNELQSIEQLTDHFPKLEKLILGRKGKFFSSESIALGRVAPSLKYLDLTASELKDPENIEPSQICRLCVRGCLWDPTPLKDCEKMMALEMQNCILENPMPKLDKLQDLNYLVMNDCGLKDPTFASKLKNLQVLGLETNPIKLEKKEDGQLPDKIAFVQNMPLLMEFRLDAEQLDMIMSYPNDLSDKWYKANIDMLAPKTDREME